MIRCTCWYGREKNGCGIDIHNIKSYRKYPLSWHIFVSRAEGWKAEALIGYSGIKTSVCVSVCSQAAGHSFWPRNLSFWHSTHWDMSKKKDSSKFWFLVLEGPFFGHFRVLSSLSFVILLYVLQVIPRDLQTSFLAHRVFMTPLCRSFNDFLKI